MSVIGHTFRLKQGGVDLEGARDWVREGERTFYVQYKVSSNSKNALDIFTTSSRPPSRISWKLFFHYRLIHVTKGLLGKVTHVWWRQPTRKQNTKVRLPITLRCFALRHRAVWFAGIDFSSQTRCLRDHDRQSEGGRQIGMLTDYITSQQPLAA